MDILFAAGIPTIGAGITNHLRQLGHHPIRRADTLTEAWAELERNPPDLVIAAWHLPPDTGVALVRQIRAHAQLSNLTTLMVSPYDDRDRVVRAVQAGVDGYLLRPFTADDLAAAIKTAIARSNSTNTLSQS